MQPVTAISQQNNQVPKSRGKKIIMRLASFFRTHRKKKIAALVLILGVLIIFRILSNQPHLVIVNTAEVFSDRFEKNVFAAGTLEVKDKQEFFAENKTTVKEILAETGQKVAKGQVILKTDESSLRLECSQKRLSCDELRAKLVQCESNLRLLEQDYNSAQQEYENIKILYENGAASKKELEDVTRKLNEAEEKLVVERDATLLFLSHS